MAESLGQDPILLYRCASVAGCWTEGEARELLSGGSDGARPLTWSHLVVLATLEDRRERARWTKRACAEAPSVRELAERLGRRGHRGDGGDGDGSEDVLERMAGAAARYLTRCAKDGFDSGGS